MNIAIIPARGGSKRIKNKNVKTFHGKPIIYYAINNLKKTNLFKKIYVSTDSEKIAKISKSLGAEVPFLRSKEISNDFTPLVPVIKDFLERLDIEIKKIKTVCCCLPCTPLLNYVDVIKAHKAFLKSKNHFILPAIKYSHPIQRAFRISSKGNIIVNKINKELIRTQDFEEYFYDSGQFYFGKPNSWLKLKNLHSDGGIYQIDKFTSVDIDNISDWKIAEKLYKLKNSKL